MVAEILEVLPLGPGALVCDGTAGLGGHSIEIAKRIRPGGILVLVDRDASMLEIARRRVESVGEVTVIARHAHFAMIPTIVDEVCKHEGIPLGIDAALLDLGVCSAQLDDPERGLSFAKSGPLDMRLDRSTGEPASRLLQRMTEDEIERVLVKYGDERWARRIARVIVERRKHKPIETTDDLVACVLEAIPPAKRERRIHPATRTMQALRIFVNAELDRLDHTLESIAALLKPNGVLAVLAYHSGEDRIVKNSFRKLSQEGFAPISTKPIRPSEEEVRQNPRARSARLRAIRRKPPVRDPEALS
jgi:16S rRNA (cytosine1402-N4)-methyltransferase